MQIEKFSVKALTVSMLLIVGIVAVAMAFVSETEYRSAAVQAQTKTVARILEVASDAALSQLATESEQLSAAAAKALSRQPELGSYLAEAPAGTSNPVLEKLLAAPLKSGLPQLKATSVRLYNNSKQQLMQTGDVETVLILQRRHEDARVWVPPPCARSADAILNELAALRSLRDRLRPWLPVHPGR